MQRDANHSVSPVVTGAQLAPQSLLEHGRPAGGRGVVENVSKGPGSGSRDSGSEDRKFNLGLEECRVGISRSARQSEDLEKITGAISSIDESFSPSSVKDNFRLGKFSKQSSKPRPILVKFVRSADVTRVLSGARSFESPIFVRPDLSPLQRARDSVLLKERWASIRIRRSKLYVDGILHGSIDSNNLFQHSAPHGALEASGLQVPSGSGSEEGTQVIEANLLSQLETGDQKVVTSLQVPPGSDSELCIQVSEDSFISQLDEMGDQEVRGGQEVNQDVS